MSLCVYAVNLFVVYLDSVCGVWIDECNAQKCSLSCRVSDWLLHVALSEILSLSSWLK